MDEIDDVRTELSSHDIRVGKGGGSVGGHITLEGLHGDKGAKSCGGHWNGGG